MYSKDMVIMCKDGLHSKVASDFVQVASKFKSSITAETDECRVDAKSLLALLSLKIFCGTPLTITADGVDEKEAVNALYAVASQTN